MASRYSLLLAAGLGVTVVHAQPLPDPDCPALVDITAVQTVNNQVEIFLRPDAAFDGFFAALTFTVRWMESDGANLGTTQQVLSGQDYFGSVVKSGPEQVDGPWRYQIYVGFGNQPLSAAGAAWVPGEEILLCRLNIINGNSYFSIVNDGWTAANNGDFFVSLNGLQCFGEIYTFTTGQEELVASGINVMPNPNDGRFDLLVNGGSASPAHVEIIDPTGRVVWQQASLPLVAGERRTIDLRDHASGVYLLQVHQDGQRTQQRIVVQRR